jgi:uncharacterized protein with von Willebrand factor type A (vWA) domain
MYYRYVQFDPSKHGREERFRQLLSFFNRLLVNTAGDVDEALRWMKAIGERHEWFDADYSFEDFRADLIGDGKVEATKAPFEGRATHRLTSRGEAWLREGALERVFESLKAGEGGEHRTLQPGGAGDETEETRAYVYGDPVDQVAWVPTFRNAIARAGGSLDLSLTEADFEIRERETNTGCATVLLIDVSHSMVLYGEDRMFPAREIALALFQLITTRYRKDTLDLVLFGDDAVHVPLHRIPYIQAGPYHTNTKAGLRMAQSILMHRRHVNKQVFMVTDGKPSAIEKDGRIYKNPFGLDRMVVNRTLDEARACRKAGISVTTFMVARDPALVRFVTEFTQLNRGRAYFTGTDRLGETLFVDYIRNRKTRL